MSILPLIINAKSKTRFLFGSHKIAGEQSCTGFCPTGSHTWMYGMKKFTSILIRDIHAAHLPAALPSNPAILPDCGSPSMGCSS
jgi:hypothetical protein